MTGALGQEVQLPDELPLLFPYLLPPKFPAASQQAAACNSMAPGAGSLAGFLPLTQPSLLPAAGLCAQRTRDASSLSQWISLPSGAV